jgi:hypothetical protein
LRPFCRFCRVSVFWRFLVRRGVLGNFGLFVRRPAFRAECGDLRDSRIMIGFHEDHESTKPRKEPCSAATQPRDPLKRQLISPNDFVVSCFRDLCETWPGASGGRLVNRATPSFTGETGPRTRSRGLRSAHYTPRGWLPRGEIVPREGQRRRRVTPFQGFFWVWLQLFSRGMARG